MPSISMTSGGGSADGLGPHVAREQPDGHQQRQRPDAVRQHQWHRPSLTLAGGLLVLSGSANSYTGSHEHRERRHTADGRRQRGGPRFDDGPGGRRHAGPEFEQPDHRRPVGCRRHGLQRRRRRPDDQPGRDDELRRPDPGQRRFGHEVRHRGADDLRRQHLRRRHDPGQRHTGPGERIRLGPRHRQPDPERRHAGQRQRSAH